MNNTRLEKDILGEINVPKDAYWGINTQRALEHFRISNKTFPKIFILSLAQVKKACILANLKLELIDKISSEALLKAVDEMLVENKFLDQFPIDIFQTGSGTQTNMNMNEVLANRANEILGFALGTKHPIHPNDHVNKSQSSNDVIPTTMHISTLNLIHNKLLPALSKIKEILKKKIIEFKNIIKVGRTHLQDAVPIPLSLEFEVFLKQIEDNENRIKNAISELYFMPLGGTALGTGINAPKKFADLALKYLSEITKFPLKSNPIKAESIASHSAIVNTSSSIKLLALALIKIANDIRWMSSGPRAGLSEIILPENEPGSSIMPGKINPTQAEALIQICLQVIGNDSVISSAEAYGSVLDLNICKPVMIINLIESITLLSQGINSFVKFCLEGLVANEIQINSHLERILTIATNLTPIIGYDKASEIVQKAYKEGKTVKQVILELGLKIKGNIDDLLDPRKMI